MRRKPTKSSAARRASSLLGRAALWCVSAAVLVPVWAPAASVVPDDMLRRLEGLRVEYLRARVEVELPPACLAPSVRLLYGAEGLSELDLTSAAVNGRLRLFPLRRKLPSRLRCVAEPAGASAGPEVFSLKITPTKSSLDEMFRVRALSGAASADFFLGNLELMNEQNYIYPVVALFNRFGELLWILPRADADVILLELNPDQLGGRAFFIEASQTLSFSLLDPFAGVMKPTIFPKAYKPHHEMISTEKGTYYLVDQKQKCFPSLLATEGHELLKTFVARVSSRGLELVLPFAYALPLRCDVSSSKAKGRADTLHLNSLQPVGMDWLVSSRNLNAVLLVGAAGVKWCGGQCEGWNVDKIPYPLLGQHSARAQGKYVLVFNNDVKDGKSENIRRDSESHVVLFDREQRTARAFYPPDADRPAVGFNVGHVEWSGEDSFRSYYPDRKHRRLLFVENRIGQAKPVFALSLAIVDPTVVPGYRFYGIKPGGR